MSIRFTYTSVTRKARFENKKIKLSPLMKNEWQTGDFVYVKVTDPGGRIRLELANGRMIEPMEGDQIIGVLGERYATLEVTGSWKHTEKDGIMHMLTGAGLIGKMESKSVFLPPLVEVEYKAHVMLNGLKSRMEDFVEETEYTPFRIPVILVVGTSMSAGKTTAARLVTRQLKLAGLTVVGAKLSGAGRFRDILSIKDAGADFVFDFMDVGLASTICPKKEYVAKLKKLLSLMAGTKADVAVVECGASPLEPYNGDIAISEIRDLVKCTILCASDPYAVYGVMKSFNVKPTITSGVATNTQAGIDLIQNLCGVEACNLLDPQSLPFLRKVLARKFNICFPQMKRKKFNSAEPQSAHS